MNLKWPFLFVVIVTAAACVILNKFFHSVATSYITYAAGGAFFVIVPFDRDYERTRRAKGLFAFAGVLLLFVGISELLRHYRVWVLTPQIEHGLAHTLAVLRGVILGILLALFVSGEIIGRRIAANKNA